MTSATVRQVVSDLTLYRFLWRDPLSCVRARSYGVGGRGHDRMNEEVTDGALGLRQRRRAAGKQQNFAP